MKPTTPSQEAAIPADAAAMRFIAELANKANNPRVFIADAEPEDVYWIDKNGNGELERIVAGPEPKSHKVRDLITLCKLAKDYEESAIWVGDEGVRLMLDSECRNSANIELIWSVQFGSIKTWTEKAACHDQPTFIRHLRTTLANACPDGVINSIRSLRFSTKEEGASEYSQGRSSIGRSLAAEVTGQSAIPETVLLSLPVYENADLASLVTTVIKCDLEVIPETRQFRLTALPGELELAKTRVLKKIAENITEILTEIKLDEVVPVYFGAP